MATPTSLSATQKDITRELANLTSGVIAGTITMLTGMELNAGDPEIQEFANAGELLIAFPDAQGLLAPMSFGGSFSGGSALTLGVGPAAALGDLMMGSTPAPGATELNDIQLSAVGEALGQMTGAMASNFSQFISSPVDVNAGQVSAFSLDGLASALPESGSGPIIAIRFSYTGPAPLEQLEAIQLVALSTLQANAGVVQAKVPSFMTQPVDLPQPVMAGVGGGSSGFADGGSSGMSGNPVTVQPVEFSSFDSHVPVTASMNKNLDLVMDVALNLTVELGRTELPIKDVLELTRGSVIELDRVAGEPVDLYANGKMIAKGEVVVIEDNFGVRITSIVAPADRLRGL